MEQAVCRPVVPGRHREVRVAEPANMAGRVTIRWMAQASTRMAHPQLIWDAAAAAAVLGKSMAGLAE